MSCKSMTCRSSQAAVEPMPKPNALSLAWQDSHVRAFFVVVWGCTGDMSIASCPSSPPPSAPDIVLNTWLVMTGRPSSPMIVTDG